MPTEKPSFTSSAKANFEDITVSSVIVSWPKALNTTPDLGGDYYVYIVRLEADEETNKNVTRVAHDSDKSLIQSRITGLKFNTNYKVSVQPYRVHNGEQDGGRATYSTKFKTNCKGKVLHIFNNTHLGGQKRNDC